MPILDLSLENPNVKAYLTRQSDRPPVGEFMFIHTHYVQGNFVSQIEEMVLRTSEFLAMNPKKKGVAIRLESLAVKLGKELGEVSEKNASEILEILRQVYEICERCKGI